MNTTQSPHSIDEVRISQIAYVHVISFTKLTSEASFIGARQQLERRMYTLNHKKRDILFLTITLANLRRFL